MRHTASGLAREGLCIASTVLPRTQSTGNRYSRKGSVWHDFLKNVNTGGRETALKTAPAEWSDRLKAIDLQGLPVDPSAYAAEVAFAYSSATGKARELGRGLSREEAYKLAREDEDVVGTSDVVGVTETQVVIIDWKSGWTDYGPVEAFLQLLTYAVLAARAYGKDEAVVGIIRLKDDGSSYWQTATLDVFALDDAEDRIRKVVTRAKVAEGSGEVPEPVEGEHCRYCPAFAHCPAKARIIHMASDVESLAQPLTPETAVQAWERIQLVKKVLERVEDAVKEYARDTPLTLPDGRILGSVEVPRSEINPELAEPILEARYGTIFAMEAVEVEKAVSKASIDKAVRRVLMNADPRLKLAKTNEAIWSELVAGGAARVRMTKQVKVHKAKAPELAQGEPAES